MKKRILAALLALCTVLAMLPGTALAANQSGKCGKNLTWTLDGAGTLTIKGSGKMFDYADDNQPWKDITPYSANIKKIVIQKGATSIGGYAFAYLRNLTSVTIPSGVTAIGDGAFVGCSSLTSVTIPSGVTEIGSQTFFMCSGLTQVTIPTSVTEIGYSTFYECKNLTSVTIPSSVTEIGYGVFYGCSSLTSMTIPPSVAHIENSAFYGCSKLTRVGIPASVSYISENAFYGCNELTDVYYAGTKEQWEAIEIDNSGNTPLLTADIRYSSKLPSSSTKTYTLTFNSNGGTVETRKKAVIGDMPYGQLPVPTRSGFTFAGWYTSRTGGSKVTVNTVAKANRTLYARWNRIRTYLVTFDPNGGEVLQDVKLAVVGSTYKALPTPTWNGWHFTGWYTAKAGGEQVTEKTRVKLTEDQTLYAQWTKTAPKVTETKSGRWTVTVPAYYALPLYSSNTGASRVSVRGEQSDCYAVKCTRRVTLSNGTTRYYGSVAGKNRWFVYTCEMELDE